jgi:hypothetical protein
VTAPEPTLASIWYGVCGGQITDKLLEWPPDLFALANTLLARAEAFRFALSPVEKWPAGRHHDWAHEVEDAGRRFSRWVEDSTAGLPDLLVEEWSFFNQRVEMPVEEIAMGRASRLCEALLTLHAIADEACAGMGVALDTANADACITRAKGRELLATRGSLARIDPLRLRVLPKVRTPPTGRVAFSRYACVQGPGVEARWHKIPARHRGTDTRSEYANLLLLPWPLRVRASDFHPVEGSLQRLTNEPFGFFEYAPTQGVDLDLLDRVLVSAREEAGSVDVVVFPESAIDEREIGDLEALLQSHGVAILNAGVRGRSREPGRFPRNWLHVGINPKLEKGRPQPIEDSERWFHIRQNKHHRWSLDEDQITQYHLGAALHPRIRWWEAMEIPRAAMHFVELAELTQAALVCEDLAQSDNIAELIRSVGPTTVICLLLDGPQLSSRWAARYASVLADDPGSAVLTLASLGMVERSRPDGRDPSRVVALWKDSASGVREIALDRDAHAVLLTVAMDRATRRSADGRWPVDNGTSCSNVAVYQVRASSVGSEQRSTGSATPTGHILETEELTILTAWAEGVSEAAAHAPERIDALLAEARAGTSWRSAFSVPEPSSRLAEAMASLGRTVLVAAAPPGLSVFDGMRAALSTPRPGETRLDGLVRQTLLAMLEKRATRQSLQMQLTS